jgi:hypothetical protein
MTQFEPNTVIIQLHDGPDGGEPIVEFTLSALWSDVPKLLGSIAHPDWQRNVVDSLNAGLAGKQLGIDYTERTFTLGGPDD